MEDELPLELDPDPELPLLSDEPLLFSEPDPELEPELELPGVDVLESLPPPPPPPGP